MPCPSRRAFLRQVAATSALATLPTGCSGGGPVDAGTLDDLVEGELLAIEGEKFALGLDEGGVYAISTKCTHLGCDMSKRGTLTLDLLECDCHGSSFDGAGAVVTGPAGQPLDFFDVVVDGGVIVVDTSIVVDAGFRVPLEETGTA